MGAANVSTTFKKPRKGFVYALREDEVRAVLDRHPGAAYEVAFGGISMSEDRQMKWFSSQSWSSWHVAAVDGRWTGDEWRIGLQVFGLREKHVGADRDAIAALLGADLDGWLGDKLAAAAPEPEATYRYFLEFRRNRKTGSLESQSFVPAGAR